VKYLITALLFTASINSSASQLDGAENCVFPDISEHKKTSEYSDEFLINWNTATGDCESHHPTESLSIRQLITLLTEFPAAPPVEGITQSVDFPHPNRLWINQERVRKDRLVTLHVKLSEHLMNLVIDRDPSDYKWYRSSQQSWDTYRKVACISPYENLEEQPVEFLRGNPIYGNYLSCLNSIYEARILDMTVVMGIDENRGWRMSSLEELGYENFVD